MNIITCAGYGGTGSSAVTDYVSEFNNVYSFGAQVEFQLLSEPDGVYNLEKAVTSGNQLLVDVAISRFKFFFNTFKSRFSVLFSKEVDICLNEYFKDLGVITWNGGWYGSHSDVEGTWRQAVSKVVFEHELEKIKYSLYEPDTAKWRPSYYTGCKQNFCYCSKEQFRAATKKFINSLLKFILKNEIPENLMIDHFVPPMEFSDYSEYVENLKVICVDSDPVDLYLRNTLFWGERWIPYEDVDVFVNWYKQTRMHRKFDVGHKNYLYIQFESLVYNYSETSKIINTFLGFSEENHINKKKFFNPETSIQNTNIEKKFELSKELKDNICKIKEELKDYLFNFAVNENLSKIQVSPIYLIREKSDKEKKCPLKLLPSALICYEKDKVAFYLKDYFKISSKKELFSEYSFRKILKIILFPIYFFKEILNSIINFILLKT